ncbi:hypothetical protein [Listeria fleischmannii]|uniref:Uncharacterized protein n=1 Tax=Listeria fleischmannii FSL S10-1203 TaxID=1265822 RepID=W7DPP2_9LIST|nr:hypothetical protein [Listeria fleischmannii]EUJ58932.1 hypothetical protein MCOL2_06722 [Listeria fleischmannii FSL S10-1203]MBC1417410.1 hypothetical protein [Listeria fleischmannii]
MSFDPMDFLSDFAGFLPFIIMIGGVLLAKRAKREAENKQKSGRPKASQSKMMQTMNEARSEYREVMKAHSKAQEKKAAKPKPKVTSGTYTSAREVQATKVDVAAKRQADRAKKQMERDSNLLDINVTRSEFEKRHRQSQKFGNMNLKQAMIVKEVLDKPVSLRNHSS